MCNDKSQFSDILQHKNPDIITTHSSIMHAEAVGTVETEADVGSKKEDVIFNNVLFAPELRINLLSACEIVRRPKDCTHKERTQRC